MSESRKLRVLHLINGLGFGGGERLLVELLRYSANYFDSEVFVTTRQGPLADTLRTLGVRVRELTREGIPNLRGLSALRTALRTTDLIHAHFHWSEFVAGIINRLRPSQPVVVTRHVTDGATGALGRGLAALVRDHIARYLAVSRSVVDSLQAEGVPGSKVHLITPRWLPPIASRPPSARGAERPWRLLVIARLHRVKGVDLLIDALTRMNGQAFTCTIVGDGPERSTLKTQAQGCAAPVTLVGAKHPNDLGAILERHDLVVLPSRSEAFPLVLVEAAAAGRPVIAADLPGVGDWVRRHEIGWTFRPGDASGLASVLHRVLDHPEELARYGANGAAAAHPHVAGPQAAEEHLAHYRAVLSQR